MTLNFFNRPLPNKSSNGWMAQRFAVITVNGGTPSTRPSEWVGSIQFNRFNSKKEFCNFTPTFNGQNHGANV
jgi:hypothetical protein